jgi:ureidoacrylate peracid hydrolase
MSAPTVRAHAELLTTLEAKVASEHTALVVIDVQNDFCAPDGMMAREGLDVTAAQEMADRLPTLLEAAREAGVLVIFVRNVYSTESNWYLSDVWLEQAGRRRSGSYTERAVCAPDSWEGDFYGDVRPRADEPIVTKHRFDAFLRTDLETILRAHHIRTVVFTGVATNVCVETTARQAFLRDYYVVIVRDGTATYSEEEHEASLRTMDRYFGEVADLQQVERLWRPLDQPLESWPSLVENRG